MMIVARGWARVQIVTFVGRFVTFLNDGLKKICEGFSIGVLKG